MFYYVYKTTNKINGKIYVGVHSTSNLDDGYLGSGNRLIYAIKKYGKENFEKEILHFFECIEDAYKLEAILVNEEFVERKDTYNIKTGGLGGFYHINQFPIEERPNIIASREKLKNGELIVGGSKHWNESSFEKVKEQARINAKRNRELGLCIVKGDKHTDETRKKLSLKSSGENNSNYGKKWYVEKDTENVAARKSFVPGTEPEGYITCEEWKRNKLKGTGNTYGTHWYNNGEISKLFRDDNVPEGWIKGRLK